MPFIVPTFNLVFNHWRPSTWIMTWPPVVGPPDHANVPGQLRGHTAKESFESQYVQGTAAHSLLMAKGFDIREPNFGTSEWAYWCEIVEVPSSSSRFFFVVGVSDQAKGFGNEYRSALLLPTNIQNSAAFAAGNPHHPYTPPWPTPYP